MVVYRFVSSLLSFEEYLVRNKGICHDSTSETGENRFDSIDVRKEDLAQDFS